MRWSGVQFLLPAPYKTRAWSHYGAKPLCHLLQRATIGATGWTVLGHQLYQIKEKQRLTFSLTADPQPYLSPGEPHPICKSVRCSAHASSPSSP